MRTTLVGLSLMLTLVAAGAEARSGDAVWIIARGGTFLPRLSQADDLLVDRSRPLALERKDWLGPAGNIELSVSLTSYLEVGQEVDGFLTEVEAPATGDSGPSITADAVLFGLTARFTKTKPDTRVAPYLGVGPDLAAWRYKETVLGSVSKANGTSVGFHLTAGVRVRASRNVALSLEYRRQFLGADMKGDFVGHHLDLTGDMFSLGVLIRLR